MRKLQKPLLIANLLKSVLRRLFLKKRAVVHAKKNVRVLECGQWQQRQPRLSFKRVNGGLLVQEADLGMVGLDDLKVVSKRQPTKKSYRILFCWKVAKYVRNRTRLLCSKQSVLVRSR